MTVSFANVQDAIKQGVIALGAVNSKAVVWADEERPAADPAVILNIVQNDADVDRECYIADPDNPGQLLWRLSTLYYIRVQVRVESQYNKPGRDAMVAAEAIRAGLRRPDLAWGAGIFNHPDINTYLHHVTFTHGSHYINAWSFETNFRAVVDFPLVANLPGAGVGIPAGTNMILVELEGDESDPPAENQDVYRPGSEP